MEKTILSFGLMAVLAIGLVSMKGGDKVVVSGRPAAVRASVAAVVDTLPTRSGKKPGAVVKAPVAVKDTAGVSSVMLDSMSFSVTTAGEDPITIQISSKKVTAQKAAKMTEAVMMMKNEMETPAPVAPVTAIAAPVGDPVAPVTAIVMPKAAVGNSVTRSATNYTERVGRMTVVAPAAAPTPASAPTAPAVDNSTYIDPIIADLKARGLIQSENPLSFRLNVHGLEVNGVQQPAEIYQFFKEKYINNSKNSFHYSLQGGSTYSSVGLTNE